MDNNVKNKNEKKNNLIIIGIIIAVIVVAVGSVGVFLLINREKGDGCKNTVNVFPGSQSDHNGTHVDKPIIYLYPEEETEVNVKLSNPQDITCSYPKYIDGWNVVAKPNGDLTYIEDGKDLYSLYYESENEVPHKVEEDGFIVKGEDAAEFLEEKLDILGLNYKEKEEFIVYWLPKLEANKYNYIRFATMDELNRNMKLEFSKEPDTLIRVMMTYKGLENLIEVKEQELKTLERKGFVVVEWGGSEIK